MSLAEFGETLWAAVKGGISYVMTSCPRALLVSASLLLASPFALCADQAPPPPQPAGASTSDVDAAYLDAERAYLKSDTQGALKQLATLLAHENDLPARARVRAHNLRGLIYFQLRNLQGAVQDFESAVQTANRNLQDSDSLLHLTRYNLGNALFQVNRPQDAYDTLSTVRHEALDSDTRMRFHHLYGNVLVARDQPLDALVQYLEAANLAHDVGARDTFLQKAANVSKQLFLRDPKADLDRITALPFDPKSPAGIAARVLMARGFMYSGDPSKAELILNDVLKDADATHPMRGKAQEMLNDLSKLGDVDPHTIGVLLPLSGKFGRFGRLCLNSILMAFNAFEEMQEPAAGTPKFRLAVRDSGESAETAQERFEELIKDEKAVAVVGPLLSKQFSAVAQRAQEYGVPLLSLSQRVDASQTGSFIFPIALSPAQQIEMIVAQAVGVNKFKRFAILAPSDSFGDSYVNLFWDSVEKAGGEVVGIERYEPKSTDFRDEMKRLLGLESLGARHIEMEDLERRKELFASTLKVKGKLRQRFLRNFDPKAVVDFDAVFVPDDPATVGQIAPSFAVLDVENIPLLGINTWNTPEIVQRAGRYLQKSLFVDGFFSGSRNHQSMQFVQEYQKNFHSVPGTIEVQAYDAAKILMEALGTGVAVNRTKLRDQLLSTAKFSGISGDYRFTEAGVKRTAHLLTVKGTNITEISSEN
ncbi:MAG: penicillin-binding protein activator [Bdellovibrionota bacterium]